MENAAYQELFLIGFSFSTWTTWTTWTKAGKSTAFVVEVKGSNPDHLDRPRHPAMTPRGVTVAPFAAR